jgi:hypothetical protein
MANREACEVYIDQEIASGLDDGKTPYAIGKEISNWVAKLFEVRISPETLKTRAARQQKKLGSNEPKESNNQSMQEQIEDNSSFENDVATSAREEEASEGPGQMPDQSTDEGLPTARGGNRANAGRPATVASKPAVTERDRDYFAEFAYPIELISNCSFSVEEACDRLLESSQTKITYFEEAIKFLTEVNEKVQFARI